MAIHSFKAIDLFAGCGGCTVGLKRSGFKVVGAVEIDAHASQVYRDNHPEVRLWVEDIRNISVQNICQELRISPGALDLLAGCPPCQGFSSVRTLNGGKRIEDTRNDLIFDFERLVQGLRPKAVMLENVPGLATDARMTRFETMLKSLGYEVNRAVLDAADFGVPQRRRRLILLAGQSKISFGKKARKQVTVRTAIERLGDPGSSGDSIHDIPEARSEQVQRLIRLIPKDGGSRSSLPDQYQLPCHQRCNGFRDIYGRMAWDRVAPTLTTGCFNPSRGRYLHPEQNRAITMREAALLQGFPKSYKFPVSFGKQRLAKLIGNALPPEFIRRHADGVRKYLAMLHGAKSKAPQLF